MSAIDGWLEADEADLLIQAATLSLAEGPTPSLVEVGSYRGRSTGILAAVAKAQRPAARVYAIDPHEGELSVAGFAAPQRGEPTASAFEAALAEAGLGDVVVTIERRSWEVRWDRPIALLFIDGLHDRESVSRDFLHFEPWLFEGAYVVFHDYGDLWPGVKEVVDELIAAGRLQRLAVAGSLIVLRSRGTGDGQASAPLPESRVDPIDPRELLHLAQLGALSAGRLLLERSQPGSVRHKRAPADLVTDADLEAERRITATIERHRPQDSILAEESGEKQGAAGVHWIVDALDGTVNYVSGTPDWAVSVAAEIRGGGGASSLRLFTPPGCGAPTRRCVAQALGATTRGCRSARPLSGPSMPASSRRASAPTRGAERSKPRGSPGCCRAFATSVVAAPPP